MPKGEDCGFQNFISSIDLLVMGRNTYDKVLSFGSWPYEKEVIVMTSCALQVPEELKDRIIPSTESPIELCDRLSAQGIKKIYVDGGALIQSFINENLITDITITVIPVLIGSGIPLFGSVKNDIEFEHISTKTYEFGFVQNKYTIKSQIKSE